jgi:hypothetical protein
MVEKTITIPENKNVKTAIKGYKMVKRTLHILYPVVFFKAALSSSLLERNSGECFIIPCLKTVNYYQGNSLLPENVYY